MLRKEGILCADVLSVAVILYWMNRRVALFAISWVVMGATLVAAAAVYILMTGSAENRDMEPVKQIGVWLGIAALFPLGVWYGPNVYSPPPDWKECQKEQRKSDER